MALVIHSSHPTLREQVRHNFQSVTNQSYRPLEVPDGKYPLPWNMHQTSSGYSREKPSAATPTKEVSETPRPGWRKGRGAAVSVRISPAGWDCAAKSWSRLRCLGTEEPYADWESAHLCHLSPLPTCTITSPPPPSPSPSLPSVPLPPTSPIPTPTPSPSHGLHHPTDISSTT